MQRGLGGNEEEKKLCFYKSPRSHGDNPVIRIYDDRIVSPRMTVRTALVTGLMNTSCAQGYLTTLAYITLHHQ